MTARRWLPGGGPLPSGAHAPVGGRRHNSSNFSLLDDESSGLPLERSEVLQALVDVVAVLFGFLFLVATGVGIAASLFILFFGWL